MADQRTDMLAGADDAPQVTGKYARCRVCNTQWQIKSFDNADAQGCTFCGADKTAISIHSEGEDD